MPTISDGDGDGYPPLIREGAEIGALTRQMRESNARRVTLIAKSNKIKSMKRKIECVEKKVSSDIEHFMGIVETLPRDEENVIWDCKRWLHRAISIARRIAFVSKKCDQETLPPIKTSLLDALQAARDEIAEMSERADQMTRRQEQSRESIARRLEMARAEAAEFRRQIASAESRAQELRVAVEEARGRARAAADRLNTVRARAIVTAMATSDPGLLASLSEVVGAGVAVSGTSRTSRTGGNADTTTPRDDAINQRQAEGLMVLAAIGTNLWSRTIKRKALENPEAPERRKQVDEGGNNNDGGSFVSEDQSPAERNAVEVQSSDFLDKLQGGVYPRPVVGPLDERLQVYCSILAHLAEDFEEELERDIMYLNS